MAKTNTTELLETLAAEIGESVYIDIAKWHLYLSDAKLHNVVAEKLYPLITSKSVNEDKVIAALESITVKVGGGRKELSLINLIFILHILNLGLLKSQQLLLCNEIFFIYSTLLN